jgi:hypothetical protein
MKNYILTTSLFCLLFITNSYSQKKASGRFNWQKKHLIEVGVSKEVQEKIETIKKLYSQKIYEVKVDTTLNEQQKQFKKKNLYKERYKEIDSLLTLQQKEQLREIRKSYKDKDEDD